MLHRTSICISRRLLECTDEPLEFDQYVLALFQLTFLCLFLEITCCRDPLCIVSFHRHTGTGVLLSGLGTKSDRSLSTFAPASTQMLLIQGDDKVHFSYSVLPFRLYLEVCEYHSFFRGCTYATGSQQNVLGSVKERRTCHSKRI